MKKLIITASGIYIVIIGIFTATLLAGSLFFLDEYTLNLPMQCSPFFLVIAYLPLTLWLLSTGIGIIVKKNWARLSLLVMAVFALFIGLVFTITSSLLPLPNRAVIPNNALRTVFLFMIAFFLILVPIIFLIFFTRKSVKEFFISNEDTLGKAKRPFGVILVIVVTFLITLFSIFYALFPYQKVAISNNMLLSGKVLQIYSWSIALLTSCIVIGLLRMQKWAWITCIVYNALSAAITILNIFTLSDETLLEIMPQINEGPQEISLVSYRIYEVIGVVISIIIVMYILSKRKFFYTTEFPTQKTTH